MNQPSRIDKWLPIGMLLFVAGCSVQQVSMPAKAQAAAETPARAVAPTPSLPPHLTGANDPATLVARESPDTAFPFVRIADANSPKKVIVHYFPPMPISLDNAAPSADYWTKQYLTVGGEGGKWADNGGYVRERPLPREPWPTTDWRDRDALLDVLRAKLMGADAFGVDIIGKQENQFWDQAERICKAAAAVQNFYFIPEIDGASFSKYTVDDVVKAAEHFARCPAVYRLNGKILFIPFAPDIESAQFWHSVKDKMDADGVQIAFVPDLLNPGKAAADFAPFSDCISAWGDRDPNSIVAGSLEKAGVSAKALTRCWMQPIAPQDARPKSFSFAEASNTSMFRDSWMQAIKTSTDYVQLITWNDYSESTELAPSSGTQFLFYDLSAYYIQWYKTGRAPQIRSDAIYYSHRSQIFNPSEDFPSGSKPFKIVGSTPLQNDIEMVAMLTQPSKLEIELNGRRTDADVQAGLQVLRIAASPGRPIFRVLREGRVVVQKVSDWTIDSNPTRHVPDYFGGSSTRAFVPPP